MRLKSLFPIFAALIVAISPLKGATPMPYHNTCDDISTVTVLNENSTSSGKWQTTTYSGNKVFRCKQSSSDAVRAVHATLWTPALEIETGKLYCASVIVGSQLSANTVSKAELAMYASPSADADKTVILEIKPLPIFSNSSRPNAVSQYFIGDASKPYLGVKNSGGGVITYFVVDDIIVEEYEGNIPPQEVQNLTATITGKEVSIGFTLPTHDILNTKLSSITKVSLLRNNKVIEEWTNQQPGATKTYSETVSTAGQYNYTVVCTNIDADSHTTQSVTIEGIAEPSRCTTYERDEEGNLIGNNYYAPAVYVPGEGIKITWKPSTEANVTYNIIRIGDNKVIATNTTETEAWDTDYQLNTPATYQYIIQQSDGNTEQTLWTSSAVLLNNTLPFSPAVSASALNEFTIIDDNRDTNCWTVITNGSEEKHGVNTFFTTTRRGDDWMISPGLALEAGKTYRIDVDALCSDMIATNVELQVMAGNSNSLESMTENIIPAFIFNHMFPKTYTAFYTPKQSGNTFFGIRSLDPTGENKFDDLGVSSIFISEVSSDTPESVKDLQIIYGSTPGTATLTFTAPSKSIGGSTLSALNKIEVYQNNELIYNVLNPNGGIKYNIDVTFTPGTEVNFEVVPFSSNLSALPATITSMLLETPYTNTFDSVDELAHYTIINPNFDDNVWNYMELNKAIRCFCFNGTNNDYIVTPAIHLEKGHFYKIDFLTWLDKEDTELNNSIKVLLGKAPTEEALNTTIVEPYIVHGNFNNKVLLKDWFTVPESGAYYIAWYAKSTPNFGQELYVDNVNISAKIPDTYPAGVDNFNIAPDATGALKATISFDLPTKDMAGKDLTSDFYEYKLYCDGMEISNGAGVRGKHIAFEHQTTQGVHLYTVRCFGAANEPTFDVENIAYIGINRPGAVEFVEVEENPNKYGEVTITWGLPVGDIDGFALNTSDISYTVGEFYTDPNLGIQQEIVYATDVRELSFTKTVKNSTDEQQFMRFFVRAKTPAGEGSPTVITKFAAIGKPFDLPFVESFANGSPQHIMMQEKPFEGRVAQWGYNTENSITGVQPVDNDKGLAMMEVLEPDNGARLFTLRINLNTENPIMTFYVYNQSNAQRTDNNLLGISIREGDESFQTIVTKSINEWANGNPGWSKAQVDLSEYAGKIVYIGFDGYAKNLTFTHIDHITIETQADIDLAVGGVKHPQIYVGIEHEIEAEILNYGSKAVNNIQVNLYLDDKKLDTRTIDNLNIREEKTITFSNTLSREDVGKHAYSIEVKTDGDADLLNNIVQAASFYLQDNDFPSVEDLKASRVYEEIQLSWQQPNIPNAAQEITDDLENYPSWSTMETGGLGDYTLVDADGCGVGGFQDFDLPNIPKGSKQSFTLWDFSNEYFAYDQTITDRYKAHSGDKCLVSIYTYDSEGWTEDRLISPLLSGEAQTISFYAKALDDAHAEMIQVYYSYDGKNLSDYFDNRFSREIVGGTWTKFTYDLPEGTKYFVIEHYSNNFFLFIDDLTFTPVGDETLINNGYNVYRNDILLNDSPISTLDYTDTDADNVSVKYGVSVVYDRGESPIKELVVEPTGIENTSATIKVTTQNHEIVITGAQDLDITIVTPSGMILTSRRAAAVERISVQPGIYMVNVAGNIYKIAVK